MRAASDRTLGLVDRDDSVVVVVDVQHGFLARLAPTVRADLIGRIRFVVEVACRLDIPLLVTVEDPARNGPTDPAIRAVLPQACVDLPKRVFGLMGQPDLAARVGSLDRRTAVIVGLETDVCVLQSAVGLAHADWRALIVADACGAPGNAHNAGLSRARDLGVETMHTKGLYYEWARSLDGIARLQAEPAVRPPSDLEL